MDLNLIGKFSTVFKFVFSSFLSIEMLLISVLLLIILIVNLKQKNRTFQFVALAIYLGFVLGIMISYTTYVKTCIDSFFKAILNYFYFPSTITYFFIIIFVTIMIIYTIFSNKMTFFKKVFNVLFLSSIRLHSPKQNCFLLSVIFWNINMEQKAQRMVLSLSLGL